MSFFEQIAAALDQEGIESRVTDTTLYVPVTSNLEIQFVEIDAILPAAEVYVAAADVDLDDEAFDAMLVSVAFSVEDAVKAVAFHVATDQMITLTDDLLDGTDDRILGLEFDQVFDMDLDDDAPEMTLVQAEVGTSSVLQVQVELQDNVPVAQVRFITSMLDEVEDLVDEAISELWESEAHAVLSEEDRQQLFETVSNDLSRQNSEELDLGSFTDFDRLFDVLSLAAEHADDWEAALVPVDDGFLEDESEDFFGPLVVDENGLSPYPYDDDDLDDLDEDDLDDDEEDEDDEDDGLDGDFDEDDDLDDEDESK